MAFLKVLFLVTFLVVAVYGTGLRKRYFNIGRRGYGNRGGIFGNYGDGYGNYRRGYGNYGDDGYDNYGREYGNYDDGGYDSYGRGYGNYGDDGYGNNGRGYDNNGEGYGNYRRGYGNYGDDGYGNNGRGYDNNGEGYGNYGGGYDNYGDGYSNYGKGYDNYGYGYDTNGKGYGNKGGSYGNGIIANPFRAVGEIADDILGGFTGGVTGLGTILDDLIHLNVAATIDDVFNTIGITANAIAKVVGDVFPVLGRFLQILVLTIVKLFICVFGSPGLGGEVFGHIPPGLLNPKDLQCDGLPRISKGGYVDLSRYGPQLGIGDFDDQCNQIINHIQNQGGDSLSRSQEVLVEAIQHLSILTKQTKFYKSSVTKFLRYNLIIFGAMINSMKPNYGTQLVLHYTVSFDTQLRKYGYTTLSSQRNQIVQSLEGTSDNCDCWVKSQQTKVYTSSVNDGNDDGSNGFNESSNTEGN